MSSKINQKQKKLIDQSKIKPTDPFANIVCSNNNGVKTAAGLRVKNESAQPKQKTKNK